MTITITIIITKTIPIILSRSQPYAFSVDGSSGELVAVGGTETETQVIIARMMMKSMMMMMMMKMMKMMMTMAMIKVMMRMLIMLIRATMTMKRNIVPGLDEEYSYKTVDLPPSGEDLLTF